MKKKRCVFFFMIFQLLEINEEIYIYIMKNEKKNFVQKFGKWATAQLCCKKLIVLQVGGVLYCNMKCIAS